MTEQKTSSFSEALQSSAQFLEALEGKHGDESDSLELLAEMLSTIEAARAFFVVLLTGQSSLADHPQPWIYEAFRRCPETVPALLAKNLVMSSATKLAHARNNSQSLVQESDKVRVRVQTLIRECEIDVVAERCRAMRQSILDLLEHNAPNQENPDHHFLCRWHYDSEQLQAAKAALDEVCAC